jgi:RES domain-containing protein
MKDEKDKATPDLISKTAGRPTIYASRDAQLAAKKAQTAARQKRLRERKKLQIENAIDDLKALLDISRNVTLNCDTMNMSQIESDSATISAIADRVIKTLREDPK